MFKPSDIQKIIENSIHHTFEKAGVSPSQKTFPKPTTSVPALTEAKKPNSSLLGEALVLLPKTFLLKTEFLSSKTKEAHEKLYKAYVDATNKVSSLLDSLNPEEAGALSSAFRANKMDEQYNLNASKLHELYFTNISDQVSHIAVDSLPYMRLARDFGTFDRWQFDFRGCALSSREGWAVCYFEPYKNRYMNCILDGHSLGIPLGGIPIIVLDMWGHSYHRDYLDDKKSYANAMMRELNWNVIEARMSVAEKANVDTVFHIQPVSNSVPERILNAVAADNAPISQEQVQNSDITDSAPGPQVGEQSNPSQGKPAWGISNRGGNFQ